MAMQQSVRRSLIAAFGRGVQDAGYRPVRGPSAAAALYYRRSGDLILTLGLELSRHYNNRHTCSFYLGRCFCWACVFPGMPHEAYERVTRFLNDDERASLLDPEYCAPGVVDGWWTSAHEAAVEASVRAAVLAETRFLAQPGVVGRVRGCTALAAHLDLVRLAAASASRLQAAPPNLRFQPKRYPRDVPAQWYWGAEQACMDAGVPEPRYTVPMLAVDAWRLAELP
jgi:hypothetical protein